MDDPFRLDRFVEAQDRGGTFATAMDELRAGHKRSHWMWFVFPQIAGLGRSPTAREYAISGLDEARAYLAHPVLGSRLREGARILLGLAPTASAAAVLGGIDAIKLRSSMTLFDAAAPAEPAFASVLSRYFDGARDEATRRMLAELAAKRAR